MESFVELAFGFERVETRLKRLETFFQVDKPVARFEFVREFLDFEDALFHEFGATSLVEPFVLVEGEGTFDSLVARLSRTLPPPLPHQYRNG